MYKNNCTRYPHNILFHQINLDLLRTILFPDGLPPSGSDFDTVIHLRLGDIIFKKNPAYKQISCEYIIECLEMIYTKRKKMLNILFVSDIRTTYEINLYQKRYHTEISKLPYVRNVNLQSSSVENDFKRLMQFKYVIMAISSFSYWASLLSTNAVEIHVPFFRFTKEEIGVENWLRTNMKNIVLHKRC